MIQFYTAGTPNGRKISIMLEEIAIPYTLHTLDFGKAEQKEESFLKINPNGRIPAIVDTDNGDFAVFESGAILIYLAEKTGKLLSTDPKERSITFQWLMFQMAGLGPMQGQANHFFKFAPEKIAYGIKRYTDETKRLYSVLERRLKEVPFLAGNSISIADIATWPWVHARHYIELSLDEYPSVQAWDEKLKVRPAFVKGNSIP